MTLTADRSADLDRLTADLPALEAAHTLAVAQLMAAQQDYERGTGPLVAVTSAQDAAERTLSELEAHKAALSVVGEAQTLTQQKAEAVRLAARIVDTARALYLTESESLRRLEAAERELHAARQHVRQARNRALQLRQTGRNAVASLRALIGLPSPRVASLTQLEKAQFDQDTAPWRFSPDDVPDRLDLIGLLTPMSEDDTEIEHARRWTELLATLDAWKARN